MKNNFWVVIVVLGLSAFLGKTISEKLLSNHEVVANTTPSKHISEIKSQNITNQDLQKVVSDSTIVMWGSSELSMPGEECPFNIMPITFNKHVLAIGHGGAQSFAALGFLATHRELIKNKKIVILVSPNWFCGESGINGTHPALYSQFFDYENYNPQIINNSVKKTFSSYYIKHKEDLKYYYPKSTKFLEGNTVSISNTIFETGIYLKEYFLKINEVPTHTTIEKIDFENKNIENINVFFDSLKIESQKKFLQTCSNNDYGIYDDYYTKYCIGKLPFTLIPPNKNENQELVDFKNLLSFLKTESYKPLVILLPVNPYAYDLKEFIPFKHLIENEIKKYKFPFLDLFVNDTSSYEKGICKDAMHTGPLGWIKINKEILKTYYSNEYRN